MGKAIYKPYNRNISVISLVGDETFGGSMNLHRLLNPLLAGSVAFLLLSACTTTTVTPEPSTATVSETATVTVSETATAVETVSTTETPAASGEVVEIKAADGSTTNISIPTVEADKTNVAFVYVGPIGDGGWTYAHNEGRLYLEANGKDIHTAYIESVPEGADAERVIRSLARQGFNVIFTTSFGFMDPTVTVAAEFPDITFIHISGQKKADPNFGNVFGAMEEMKYIAGMVAGAKAMEDGTKRVGIIAPYPIAEVIRLSNAAALGMRRTCPDCIMDIRWINSWFDPVKEREASLSMLDAGASVIIGGSDTSGPVQAAGEKGKFGTGYDSRNSCDGMEAFCLGVAYWNWGPVYLDIVSQVQAGTYVPEDYYGSYADGLVGFLGFGEGETPFASIPASVIPEVQAVLAEMKAGTFTRFEIFAGPLNDNQGKEILPAGAKLTQSDLEGLNEGYLSAFSIEGRDACTVCMNYLVEGFDTAASIPQN